MRSIIGKRSVSRMVSGGLFAALFAFGSAPALAATGDPLNLTVTKTAQFVGGTLTYTITVANDGTQDASTPQLYDPLPDGISWSQEVTQEGSPLGCTIDAGNSFSPPFTNAAVLWCDMDLIPAGTTRTIVVTGTGACGTVENTATAYTHLVSGGPEVAFVSNTVQNALPSCSGRMTGGGSIFANDAKKSRVTHGFELYCNANDPRQNLEINWAGGGKNQSNFHLTSLTSANCYYDSAFAPQPPNAGFNTFEGSGEGTCNGQPATIRFIFTDAGEPGTSDMARYDIAGTGPATAACTLSAGLTALTKGNQQAHK